MPAFEIVDLQNPASFFLAYDQNNFETCSLPDFTGDRVRAYTELRDIATQIQYLDRAFPPARDDNVGYFDQCPESFSSDRLKKFQSDINSKDGVSMCRAVKAYQERTVRSWNPEVDEPTKTIYLGLLGVDESASKECGAIALDLLLRSGVLVENDDSSWDLADDYETRRIYLYGDAKTLENMVKFVRDMQNRRISYSVANMQAEIFLKALDIVMEMPGDWHAGLQMAQTIFKYCYVGFLDNFQLLLE